MSESERLERLEKAAKSVLHALLIHTDLPETTSKQLWAIIDDLEREAH